MTRRELLRLAAAPAVDYRDYSRCLPDYLTRLASEAAARREQALSAIRTADDLRKRQSTLMTRLGMVINRIGEAQR